MTVWAIIKNKDGKMLIALPTKWQAVSYKNNDYSYYNKGTLKIVKCIIKPTLISKRFNN
jgi:hypothetical protein